MCLWLTITNCSGQPPSNHFRLLLIWKGKYYVMWSCSSWILFLSGGHIISRQMKSTHTTIYHYSPYSCHY
jgi:hypothetical protein